MKKLNLNRETVRNLTSSDLDVVAGGKPPTPCDETIPTEWPTCETCETCDTCGCTDTCPPDTVNPPCTSGAKICICDNSQ